MVMDTQSFRNKQLTYIVTAGPTREFIDPVRFLSNPSTGKMGYALAEAAYESGGHVTLISGPASLSVSEGIQKIDVVSAEDMCREVLRYINTIDVLIMAAAVSDFTPAMVSDQKIKKGAVDLTLSFIRTKDILEEVRKTGFNGTVVGFAAETEHLEEHARTKLTRKKLNIIVANDITQPGAGFASDTNIVTLFTDANDTTVLPQKSKMELARYIIDYIRKYRQGNQSIGGTHERSF